MVDMIDKKERQREHVRRSYYRKINKVRGTKELVRVLSEQHKAAVAQQERLLKLQNQDPAAIEQSRVHVMQLYLDATKLTEELRQEHEELQTLLDEREKLGFKVQHVVEGFADDLAPTDMQSVMDTLMSPFFSLSMRPTSAAECQELVSSAYTEICEFMVNQESTTTGTGIFGWHDRRTIEQDHLNYSMYKLIPGKTTAELCQRSWALYSTPEGMASLYPDTWNVKLRCLQTIDDDNVILHRAFLNSDAGICLQSLFLVSRFQTESGFAIIFRSINQSHLVEDELAPEFADCEKQWLDVYTWLLFDEVEGQTTTKFGGIVANSPLADSTVWTIEVLLIALRWENHVVGPIFALQA